ncbi:DEAD/DEAH box helicase [Clostridium estertheticum]|uniref:DEAD/DEAH box helicase n=1 Tax=Clostridium estertheticum TaxID=238834 RepID=UPI001CD0EBE6|nr:DEAD/DEAH box helicase [Clostridium estertheticum]MBZ9687290.1 DEAD/DEAH box helicase [Clostridium estertheticum]
MNDINEEIIQKNSDSGSYKRGREYYLNNKVKYIDIDINEKGNYIETKINSKVESSKFTQYKVNTSFNNIAPFIIYHCECNANYSYYGQTSMCKHVVATLLKYFYEKEQIIKVKKMGKTNKLIKQITENLSSAPREKLNLKLDIKYVHDSNSDNRKSSFELKIGEDKLYVVKNIREFLLCSSKTIETLEFGKKFSYNPHLQCFNTEDLNIIEIFKEAGELETLIANVDTYRSSKVKFLSGKKAYFTDSMVKRLFKCINNRAITVVINGEIFTNVHVLQESMPLQFEINRENNKFVLQQKEHMPIALCNDGEFFFYAGEIYETAKEQRESYLPLYNRFKEENKNYMEFYEEEKDDVASFLLPTLKKISNGVSIDKSLENEFYLEELKAMVFFEKIFENVEVFITFKYGDIKINPFNSSENKTQEGRVLIRDIEKEMSIINQFHKFGFVNTVDGLEVKDETNLLEFLVSGLEKLQGVAEVYYSEEFKKIKVHGKSGYKSNIRLNKDNLLEFSFSIEGVDNIELSNIFSALREKRKYYRLKNGSFVLLDSNNLVNIAQMMEYLNIKDSDISKNKILLSKYNAIYIEEKLKREEMDFVETNKKFIDLVHNVKDTSEIKVTVPKTLDSIMRTYQKVGFKWLKTLASCGFGGILADEMGLGKTLQAIALIQSEVEENEDKQPSLVVCPTSLVYNWKDEIEEFAPQVNCIVVSGNKSQREEQKQNIENTDVVITSYALIRRDIEDYEKIKFRYCFLDEAQQIKNFNSLNAHSVKNINAQGKFALTGTPIENSLMELWSIFDFIMPGYLLKHSAFSKKYEVPIVKDGSREALQELNNHVRPFILRRTKLEVASELPPKIEHRISVEMTEEQKKLYVAYLKDAKGELEEDIAMKGFNKSKFKVLSILTRLRQICCDPSTFIEDYVGGSGKMEALDEILENSLEEGHRILIFSQFTKVLKNISKRLDTKDIKYMYLDGSTKAEKRIQMVKTFNEGDTQVFLISLKAGGTGINLTGADMVIHFDPWWNPAVEAQATDRAHRIGQKKTVEVIKLIARGTIEEKIFKLQQKKSEIIETVINDETGAELFLSQMSQNEIQDLFL